MSGVVNGNDLPINSGRFPIIEDGGEIDFHVGIPQAEVPLHGGRVVRFKYNDSGACCHPGKLSMGSAGVGSGNHLSGELFKMTAGVNMIHVPYRGEAPALADMLGGQVQVIFGTIPGTIEYIRSGRPPQRVRRRCRTCRP